MLKKTKELMIKICNTCNKRLSQKLSILIYKNVNVKLDKVQVERIEDLLHILIKEKRRFAILYTETDDEFKEGTVIFLTQKSIITLLNMFEKEKSKFIVNLAHFSSQKKSIIEDIGNIVNSTYLNEFSNILKMDLSFKSKPLIYDSFSKAISKLLVNYTLKSGVVITEKVIDITLDIDILDDNLVDNAKINLLLSKGFANKLLGVKDE